MQPRPPSPERSSTNTLTAEQVDLLKRMLEAKRDELRRKNETHLANATQRTDERSEAMDVANQAASEAEFLEIAERERKLLLEVERALDKLKHGMYGISESTGAPIGFQRLLAVPWARNEAREEELLERTARQQRPH